ncbi:hypothetical protein, partial [Pantoea agglomerans]|uniref:hypothetical protein n=1 Tax=Enterobacter agglomerans TaxID=549 RepID=UPI001CA42610
ISPFGNLQYPFPLLTIEKKLISGSCPAPFPTVFFAASPKPRFLRNKRLALRRAALAHLRPFAERSGC